MNVKSYFLTPKDNLSHKIEIPESVVDQCEKLKIDNEHVSFSYPILKIFNQLKEIYQLKNSPADFSLDYFLELFDNQVSEENKSVLVQEIKNIGYEKLKNSFEKINLECENYFCETENLFVILKRHQFNKKEPESDHQKLKQIIQFMHITLIHLNILHNNKDHVLTECLVSIKNKAFKKIEPFVNKVDDIFVDILKVKNSENIFI